MPTPKLSHVRPGQALSAATINAIIDAVNTGRIAGVAVGSGLGMVRGPAGVTLTSTSTASVGAWAFLPEGTTISGASGAILGTGTVTLCSRSGDTLTADKYDVTVYNAGGSVTAGAGGRYCKLGWTDGVWSLDVFPCS